MSSIPFVYADFQNADPQGRVRLNCVGTLDDLSQKQVQLREGLKLNLYTDDTDSGGQVGRLLVEGEVTYSNDEHCWVAVISWDEICREQVTAAEARLKPPAPEISRAGDGSNMPPSHPATR